MRNIQTKFDSIKDMKLLFLFQGKKKQLIMELCLESKKYSQLSIP